ncbi:MAG: hypothetical protein M1814_004016 [Vezdaea aestivalis]|nr:MAG: hypothetical protein M1814_004016 [Vezdaea aestivalis]
MGSRPQTPALAEGPGAIPAHPVETTPLPQSQPNQQFQEVHFREEFDASQRGSSIVDGEVLYRPTSAMSTSATVTSPSRGGTLKKKASLSRKTSLRRTSSRRSSMAGSVRSVAMGDREKYGGEGNEQNSVFFTPVPTSGNPTEVLVNRFQAWRKILKDLITYFREIQVTYEQRSKSLLKVSNVINNTNIPSMFLQKGGLGDATEIFRDFHKQSIAEGNKARELANNVVLQLTGLRSDLNQKIKEIKSLSGDFKNSVDKEVDNTKKAVRHLQEALGMVDTEPAAVSGKGDPFIVKLAVDRQVERQIEEENYLHRAYLNMEGSGRELESIVVGEIQKAYSIYASLLRREADESYETADKLKTGPLALTKDHEWTAFVEQDKQFIDPRVSIRSVQDIEYPGRDHPAAAEVRSGMLERKSKYLKSYTAGWYVLSPTHLHEFKSADQISAQAPVMSLYLPEQKLGSHAQPNSTSHKFMLKGRQTGSMHRGHSWVFRAESHDTMLAWYEAMRALTEKSGAERDNYVRKHARSISGGSQKAPSISSHGSMEEDEADAQPYSAAASSVATSGAVVGQSDGRPQRPQPGGRFPSDLQINRGLLAKTSTSSNSDDGIADADRSIVAAAGALPGSELMTVREGDRSAPERHLSAQSPISPIVGGYGEVGNSRNLDGSLGDPALGVAGGSGSAPVGRVSRDLASKDRVDYDVAPVSVVPLVASIRGSASTDSRALDLPLTASSPTSISTAATLPEDRFGTSASAAAFKAKELATGPGAASQTAYFDRPNPTSHASAKSASELHVPGEYPKTPNALQ